MAVQIVAENLTYVAHSSKGNDAFYKMVQSKYECLKRVETTFSAKMSPKQRVRRARSIPDWWL